MMTDRRLRRFPWPAMLRPDTGATLALLSLVSGGLLVFLWLAGEVAEGDTGVFDRTILLALRNAADPARPLGPPWLETVARDVTSLGSTTVLTLLSLFMAGFLLLLRARLEALLVIGAMGGGSLLSTVLKQVFDRSRPDLLPHVVEAMNASFPSGHATLSTVAYLILGVALTRLSLTRPVKVYILSGAIALPLSIGLSRVYLGVHWPTDVLAGWCLGASWALLWWTVAQWVRRDGTGTSEGGGVTPFPESGARRLAVPAGPEAGKSGSSVSAMPPLPSSDGNRL